MIMIVRARRPRRARLGAAGVDDHRALGVQ